MPFQSYAKWARMSNVDHVKAHEQSIKNCLVRLSHFPLTSKLLFARARQFLALSARAASVFIPSTLDSRPSSTENNMAPAVANGPIEPSGASTKGSKSSKMHSKVVGFPLPFSLSSWYRFGSLERSRPDLRQLSMPRFVYMRPVSATYIFTNH